MARLSLNWLPQLPCSGLSLGSALLSGPALVQSFPVPYSMTAPTHHTLCVTSFCVLPVWYLTQTVPSQYSGSWSDPVAALIGARILDSRTLYISRDLTCEVVICQLDKSIESCCLLSP